MRRLPAAPGHVPAVCSIAQRSRSTCPAAGWCLVCELEKLALKAHPSGGPASNVLSVKGIVQNLKRISKTMRLGSQEDAHEFFVQVRRARGALCVNTSVLWHAMLQHSVILGRSDVAQAAMCWQQSSCGMLPCTPAAMLTTSTCTH
jgi:hypothetical protein